MKLFSKKTLGFTLIICAVFSAGYFINTQRTEALTLCIVKSATFIPNGNQSDTWYKTSSPQNVEIIVETENCITKELTFSLFDDTFPDSKVIDSKKITVPDTGVFKINMVSGSDGCPNVTLVGKNCNYHFELTDESGTYHSNKPDEMIPAHSNSFLAYNCDNLCSNDDGNWQKSLQNGELSITEIGNSQPSTTEEWYYKVLLVTDGKPYFGPYPSKNACLVASAQAGGTATPPETYPCYQNGGTGADSITIPVQQIAGPTHNSGSTGVYNNNSAVNFKPATGTHNPFDEEYNLLAPLGAKGGTLIEKIDQTYTVGNYLNTIFLILIGLCGALAVIMIIIGGIQYMGDESIFGKTEAKSKIITSIGGLLLALGSWALLNTIDPDLLGNKGLNVAIVSSGSPDTPQEADSDRSYCGIPKTYGYLKGDLWPPSGISKDDAIKDELGIKNNLPTMGIKVKPGTACTNVGQEKCITLAGLDTTKVKNLANACKTANGGAWCEIIITAGTDYWNHGKCNADGTTYHRPGDDTVDLSFTTSLTQYIESGTNRKTWGGKYTEYTKGEFIMVKESDHYHFNKN